MDDGSDRDDGPDGWPDPQPGGSEDDQQYAPTSNQVSTVEFNHVGNETGIPTIFRPNL